MKYKSCLLLKGLFDDLCVFKLCILYLSALTLIEAVSDEIKTLKNENEGLNIIVYQPAATVMNNCSRHEPKNFWKDLISLIFTVLTNSRDHGRWGEKRLNEISSKLNIDSRV